MSAGWVVTGILALAGAISDAEALRLVAEIERDIHARPNRVRHEMNGALIALGLMGGGVRDRAMRAASRIGPVEVDHGQTGCVTLDATSYIRRDRGAQIEARGCGTTAERHVLQGETALDKDPRA